MNVEEEVNQTLAGYFTKVMTSLVNKKETEVIIIYFIIILLFYFNF